MLFFENLDLFSTESLMQPSIFTSVSQVALWHFAYMILILFLFLAFSCAST